MASPIIGLFGGAFDPPHLGHVRLAALASAYLDALWVVPAGVPVHRRLSGYASASKRLRWLRAALSPWPRVRVWDYELRRKQPTPTMITLRAAKALRPDARWVIVLGEDAFAGLARWVDWPAHAELAAFLVFARAGAPRAVAPAPLRMQALDAWRADVGTVARVEAELPRVSATELRARLQRRDPAALVWLPACVRESIWQAYAKEAR